jgi:hypothetical protein
MAPDTGPGQSRAAARSNRSALVLIGLGFLRSRFVVEAAIVGAFGVAALAGLARENQAQTRARLAAWYKAQSERLERSIKPT